MQRIFVNLNNKRECASLRMDACVYKQTTKIGRRIDDAIALQVRETL